MYHKVILVGNLGRDVELKYTAEGTPVANFSMAVNVGYGDKKKTMWVRVSAWRKTAEACNQYLRKGSKALVEGELRPDDNGNPRVFARNDGTSGSSYEVTAQTVKFLSSRDDAQQSESSAPQFEQAGPGVGDSPIPF